MMDDATQKLVDEWERVVSAESLRRADALIRVVGAGGRMRDALEAAQRESSGLREKLEISMAVGAKDAAERDALEAAQRPPVELAMSPEDIAAEYAPFDGSDPDTVIHVRGLIAAAIREDRAQRPPVSPEVQEVLAVVESALAFWNNGRGHHDAAWVSRMAYNMGDALQRAATALRLVARFSFPQRPPVSRAGEAELIDAIESAWTDDDPEFSAIIAKAILARFSFPTLDVERLTRWLVENRRLVAGSAWEYVDSEGTASALVAALRSGELTREETNE